MKQYVGISRDHSGSMASSRLTHAAMKDYNATIQEIKQASAANDIDTIVSVVRQGGGVHREIVNSNITLLRPLTSYNAPGSDTPLFDSVGELIELIRNSPDYGQPGVTYLVMAITDGQENASRLWHAQRLGAAIRELQATDKWTFVFRVPYGNKRDLTRTLGIPEGNVQEWEQTERGFQAHAGAVDFFLELVDFAFFATAEFFLDSLELFE